jgi:hypothetical protein
LLTLRPSIAKETPARARLVDRDLRIRVGEREDHLPLADHLLFYEPGLPRSRDDDVGGSHDLLERDGRAAVLREDLRGGGVDVGAEQLADSVGLQQLGDPDAGGPQPDQADRIVLHLHSHLVGDVEQHGEDHDGGAVLVVVQHGDVEHRGEPVLDAEALGGLDVLELDRPESRRDRRDGADDLLRVLRPDEDRDAVDAHLRVEERRLALHDRHAGHRADVPETEDGGPVRDDRDRVSDGGVPVRQVGVGLDDSANLGDAGGVDLADGGDAVDLDPRPDADLAALVELEHRVDDLGNDHAFEFPELFPDPPDLGLVVGEDRDVARVVFVAHPDQPDVAQGAAGGADRRGELSEIAGLVEKHDPEGHHDLIDALFHLHGKMIVFSVHLCQSRNLSLQRDREWPRFALRSPGSATAAARCCRGSSITAKEAPVRGRDSSRG